MPWVKHGLIIEPKGQAGWIGTHAALPVLHVTGATRPGLLQLT